MKTFGGIAIGKVQGGKQRFSCDTVSDDLQGVSRLPRLTSCQHNYGTDVAKMAPEAQMSRDSQDGDEDGGGSDY